MKLLIGLLFIAVVAYVITLAVASFSPEKREVRRLDKEARRATQERLTAAEQRASIATKALRAIANGAGAPVLEAQDALDKIETTYDNHKEIL